MRTTSDRIRHAVLFELLGLVIVTPAGALAFNVPMVNFGVVAAFSTAIAMAWNYIYNLGFDHALLRLLKSVRKTLRIRFIHAALFEAGLICLLIPLIAWYLGVSMWQAFIMDASLAGFYFVYAFTFNWAYDIIFPITALETSD